MIRLKSFLQDEFRDGEGEGATLVDPTTEEPVATTSTKGLDFAGAFAHARTVGGPKLRAMTFAERGALLKAMSKTLYEQRDALLEASMINAGTTRTDGKFDVDGATGTLAYYASVGKKLGDRTYLVEGEGEQLTRSARFWGHHVKVPRQGVAVHVNAFNFPAWGFAEKAAVALLAGMPVITKPATATALTTFRCFEALAAAGLLEGGVMQMVCGSAGDMLSNLGPQDVLAFTGSGDTGALFRRLDGVVERSVRVNVEADSLNAVVLGPDVEPGTDTWQMFVRDCAKEITQKTGQKCTATRRIFVPRAKLDAVVAALSEELAQVKFGDPRQEGVRVGPLASKQQFDDVRSGIGALVEAGCAIAWKGDAPEGKGYFVPATLLTHDAPGQAAIVHEREVFGPVSTVLPYDSVDEAIRFVGLGEGGLVASVYCDDKATLGDLILGLAPWSGRVLAGSKKVADQAISPGMVLPSCVHGGPGRAGGGEELGGLRGLDFYFQRTAVQGDRALLDRIFGLK